MVVNFTWLLSALVLPVLLSTPVAARSPNFFKGIKGNETFICNARGRFAHPTDCVSFFDCKRNPAHGGLSAIRQRCPPTEGFHHKLKKCISLKKLRGCNPRQGRTDTLSPEYNRLCGGAASFFCADCQTLVHCIDGSAWTENCGASDFCAEGKAEFKDAVCYTSEKVENCTCAGKPSFAPDPYDVTKFFHCDSEEAEPEFYHCPINNEFDPETKKCEDLEGLPACTKQGDFAHPEICSKYYSCLSSRDGWLRKSHECGPKEMFSEVNSTCENPCSWANSGDFACTREGRFRDVTDCRRFYVCISSAEGFITKKRSCPDKHHWQSTEEGGSSGKCVSDNESECTVVAPSKCVVPTEWCPSSETGAEGSDSGNVDAAGGHTTEEPATEEPATEEPATEEPATEEPEAEKPKAGGPGVGGSGVGGPGAGGPEAGPTTEEPATEEPGEGGPGADGPSTQNPVEESLTDDTTTKKPADAVDTEVTTDVNDTEENLLGNDIDPTSATTEVAVTEEPTTTAGSEADTAADPDDTSSSSSNFVVRSGVEPSKKDDPIAFIRNLLNKNY